MLLGTTAIALVANLSSSHADTVIWGGTQSSNWAVDNNWFRIGGASTVPTAADDVFFNTTAPSAVLSSGSGYSRGIVVGQANYTGAFTISSGAALNSSGSAFIGYDQHANGTVTVTGTNSTWNITNSALYVGYYGTGTLNLAAGGAVGASQVSIGNYASGAGAVTIDGTGSLLLAFNSMTIGEYGTGTLKVSNGGHAQASWFGPVDVNVGHYAGASGAIAVDGAGSQFYTNGLLSVGGAGTGTVDITNGGKLVATDSLQMAAGVAGQGTITASGSGTLLQVGSSANSYVKVGYVGAASVSILAGATANLTGSLMVADQVTSTASVTVSGAGSSLTVSPFNGFGGGATIGSQGNGSLAVSAGATVTVDGMLIGSQPNGHGIVTVDGKGSTLTVAQTSGSSVFYVGDYGHGTLAVTGGGVVNAGGAYVGAKASGVGAVTISGSGSALTIFALDIGRSGTGTVDVAEGGSLVAHNHLYIGYNAGSTGTLNVDGPNSSASFGNFFDVGVAGTGTANVTRGGSITAYDASVGSAAGGLGTLNVDGAGSSFSARTLTVGRASTGWFNLTGGATANINSATIGSMAGSGGVINVSGQGSTLTASGIAGQANSSLTIGASGDGSLIVANGGKVVVQNNPILIGNQAGSSGKLIIGAYTGGTAVAAGTVSASGIVFGAGNNQVIFNHTDTAYTFDVPMSGSAAIYQQAGHTILTGDSSGFTGIASVTGGILSVNGSLSGASVIVNNDATLGGNGTIGSLQLQGGILAPGNSIGTLNVAGNALITSGSIYQVQVSPTASDKLAVAGTTTITGGTVQAQVGAGAYSATNRYTILTSAGGVTGAFTGVTSDAAFLTPSLSYDANDVYLTLTRNVASFGSVGTTRNQVATGIAVDAYGYGNAMWNSVVMLNAAQARSAFDQLSGDIHASTRSALIEDSRLLRDAAVDRIRDAFSGLGLPGNPAMAYASLDQAPARPDAPAVVWGRLIGSWGATASDGNAASLSRDTKGLISGADLLVAEGIRLGVLTGYSRTSLRSDTINATAGSDDYHVGVYAGSQHGALGLRGGAAYSWHDIGTTRMIAFPGLAGRVTSDHRAETAQAFGEFAYRFDVAPRSAVEPFAAVAWVGLHSNGFAEAGSVAALTGTSGDTSVTFSTLGLRGSSQVEVGGAAVTLKGTLGWRHAFGDVTPVAAVAFAGGNPFTIAGVPIARDAAAVDAGLSVALTRNATVGVAYTGQIAKGAHDNGVKADFTWKF